MNTSVITAEEHGSDLKDSGGPYHILMSLGKP